MPASITLSMPTDIDDKDFDSAYKLNCDITGISATTNAFMLLDNADLGSAGLTSEQVDAVGAYWWQGTWTGKGSANGYYRNKLLGQWKDDQIEGTLYLYCQNTNDLLWYRQDSADYSFIGTTGELYEESVGLTSVTISFDSIPRADKYRFYVWYDSSMTDYFGFDTTYEEDEITYLNLKPGTTYYIRYLGMNDYTYSEISDYIRITTNSNFSWTYEKNAGEPFNLTSSEWKSFLQTINDLRWSLGEDEYNFSNTSYMDPGDTFTASMANEARDAIQSLGGGAGGYIVEVTPGQNITAYYMNTLVSELNAAINNL